MNTSNSPINASGGTFTISDLSYGITYTITLQNRNVTGQSAFSVSGSVYTPALPTKPTITSLTQSGNTVIVAYTDNDLPIDYNTYAITPYYSIDDGAYTSSNTQINAATSPINASGGIFIISDLLYGSTYNIQVQNRNVFGSGLPSDTSSITMSQPEYSNICFLAGTPITVDQGIIAIDKIDTTIHTIRGKPIIGISKTISNGDYLMCFEKNALGPNVPTTRTIMSPLHKIMYNNNWVIAKDLFGKSRYKIKTVSYNEECLYNVIMETHETMLVNNMIVETLHPDNPNSKIFTVCN
jgi:hypothetical protein